MNMEANTPVGLQVLYSKYRYHTVGIRTALSELQHKAWMWLVWRLPRRLIYFAVIRVWAHGTMGQYGNTRPDDLGWNEALKRWEKR